MNISPTPPVAATYPQANPPAPSQGSNVGTSGSGATASAPPQAIPSQFNAASAVNPLSSSGKSDAETDPDQIKQAIENANEALKNLQNQSNALEFSVDKDLGRIIVRLVDTKTKEVIRQYPPEEVLEIARQMDKLVGKLLKDKA